MTIHGTHAWQQQTQPPAALPPPVGWVLQQCLQCTCALLPKLQPIAVHTSETHFAVLHLHCVLRRSLAAACLSMLVLGLAGVAEGLAGRQTVSSSSHRHAAAKGP